MAKIGAVSKVLRETRRVLARAVLWKIPHDTPLDDIRLKLGRYKRSDDDPFADDVPETLEPKSELTLDDEEFKALIEFLREQYEPFRQGVKAFIPLERPYDAENAAQIRALFSLPDTQKLVRFILTNNVIPEELAAGLQQARRIRAVKQFETMLQEDRRENDWQSLGSQHGVRLG